MFPFRRGGGKKRAKGGPAPGGHPGQQPFSRRGKDGHPQRRASGGAFDLLNLMPSTTKALAQMLAGNTRASGQLAHARNVMAQAERAVEERQIDRLIPADREEFLEQYARLKLTLADAEAMEDEEPEDALPVEPRQVPVVAPERLRELALKLATSSPPPQPGPQEPPEEPEPAEPEPEPESSQEEPAESERRSGAAHRRPVLRLKRAGDSA